MLTTQNTIPMQFGSAASALQYVNARTYRRYLIDKQTTHLICRGERQFTPTDAHL